MAQVEGYGTLRTVYKGGRNANLGSNPGVLVDPTLSALAVEDAWLAGTVQGQVYTINNYYAQLAAAASATLMLSGHVNDIYAIITVANTSSECCAQLSEFTGATASGTTLGPGSNLNRGSTNVSLLSGQIDVVPVTATGETLLQSICIPANYFASFGATNGRNEWILSGGKKYLVKVGNTGQAPADVTINVTYYEI